MKMFELLVKMGYKEIEVGFPAASQTDFDFVRQLVEEDRIPDDVRVSVLTQAREDLIARTVESLQGADKATVHLYNATAPLFQRVVFNVTEAECIAIATRGTEWVMKYADQLLAGTDFGYQYSPEIFTQTPTDFALEVCERVSDVWQPEEGREIVLNLPATVEMSTPNTYADQIEYFSRNLTRRAHSAISLHPHNDRGTAVAATELALMAGADRVEGCLFGHGERTGNVDLVTLAHEPVHARASTRRSTSRTSTRSAARSSTAPSCRSTPATRTPATSSTPPSRGSHQDAIKKGLEDLDRIAAEQGKPVGEIPWEAPYLPIDPKDVGRTYEAVIRVNSQSGKGGVAYVLKAEHSLDLPRRAQIEFSRVIQQHTDTAGRRGHPRGHLGDLPQGVPRPRGALQPGRLLLDHRPGGRRPPGGPPPRPR